MGKKRAMTMLDVAKRARVSLSTVSHVINNTRHVRSGTKKRVLDAMQALSYHPNVIAQSLRRKKTNTVALIISSITNPFYPEAVRGIEEKLSERGISIIVGDTHNSEEKERELTTLLYGKRVDGFIIVPSSKKSDHIAFLMQHRIPVVQLDRTIPALDTDAVVVDNVGGCEALTRHLISIGHTRVAIITGPLEMSTASDRLTGYLRALDEAGIQKEDDLIRVGDFERSSGYAHTVALLNLDSKPTALVACNNMMGLGALEALTDKGVLVPSEMGIAMFDELPWFKYLNPALTTIDQPAFDLGTAAAELLLERMGGERETTTRLVLPVKLTVRSSAGENQMFLVR